jgi:hypothetical protein
MGLVRGGGGRDRILVPLAMDSAVEAMPAPLRAASAR